MVTLFGVLLLTSGICVNASVVKFLYFYEETQGPSWHESLGIDITVQVPPTFVPRGKADYELVGYLDSPVYHSFVAQSKLVYPSETIGGLGCRFWFMEADKVFVNYNASGYGCFPPMGLRVQLVQVIRESETGKELGTKALLEGYLKIPVCDFDAKAISITLGPVPVR